MAKTDKELTAEIVNTYVSSWNGAHNTQPIKTDVLLNIIKSVHKTISELPETKEK
jgi:predicted transcriptional regulator